MIAGPAAISFVGAHGRTVETVGSGIHAEEEARHRQTSTRGEEARYDVRMVQETLDAFVQSATNRLHLLVLTYVKDHWQDVQQNLCWDPLRYYSLQFPVA